MWERRLANTDVERTLGLGAATYAELGGLLALNDYQATAELLTTVVSTLLEAAERYKQELAVRAAQ